MSHAHSCSHNLDAMALVSQAAFHHQCNANKVWSHQIVATNKCKSESSLEVPWVIFSKGFDATPLRLTFGKLSELSDIARYWNQNSNRGKGKDERKLLSKDEFLRLNKTFRGMAGALPKSGIIEVMAQTGAIGHRCLNATSATGDGLRRRRRRRRRRRLPVDSGMKVLPASNRRQRGWLSPDGRGEAILHPPLPLMPKA